MDTRIVRAIPEGGIEHAPAGAVFYHQPQVGVVLDYMTKVESKAVAEDLAKDSAVLVVSTVVGGRMKYVKDPGVDFTFVHQFAGAEVDREADAREAAAIKGRQRR